jgi:hypothetical protein
MKLGAGCGRFIDGLASSIGTDAAASIGTDAAASTDRSVPAAVDGNALLELRSEQCDAV